MPKSLVINLSQKSFHALLVGVMNVGKGIFKQAPLCMFTKDALRAYLILDFHRDSDAIKAVYNEVVEEGMEMNAHFHEMYNHIMIKYSERLPSSEYNQTASATQVKDYILCTGPS